MAAPGPNPYRPTPATMPAAARTMPARLLLVLVMVTSSTAARGCRDSPACRSRGVRFDQWVRRCRCLIDHCGQSAGRTGPNGLVQGRVVDQARVAEPEQPAD